MLKRQVWYRDSDGWWYGQIGKGRRRRQKRIHRGKNDARSRREAQRRYNKLLKSEPGLLKEMSATDRLKTIFIAFLKRHSKRHCSPETHRWYRHFLKRFAKKYGSVRFCDLAPEDVEDWLDRAQTKAGKPWSDTTRNRAITCVKVAVNWFIRRKKLKDNPLQDLQKPRSPGGRRSSVPRTQAHPPLGQGQTFQAVPVRDLPDGRPARRSPQGDGGERPSVGHVDLPAEKAQDRKKTGKPRVIYLTPALTRLCLRLAAAYPKGPLFLNTRGKAWTRNAIRIRFRRLREKFPQLKGVVCSAGGIPGPRMPWSEASHRDGGGTAWP